MLIHLLVKNSNSDISKKKSVEVDDIKNESKKVLCSSLIKVSNIKESAVLEDNISRCLDFESDVMVLRCEDNFYLAKRFNEDDFSVCENIVDEVLKNECIK